MEQIQDPANTMLSLEKKFFVNDANVDRDDPAQLHLLYTQVRIF